MKHNKPSKFLPIVPHADQFSLAMASDTSLMASIMDNARSALEKTLTPGSFTTKTKVLQEYDKVIAFHTRKADGTPDDKTARESEKIIKQMSAERIIYEALASSLEL